MNYVPGTASLIDDIDSKSPPSSGGEFWLRLWCINNRVRLLVRSLREAPGVAARWQNVDRVPQEH